MFVCLGGCALGKCLYIGSVMCTGVCLALF